MIRHRPRDAHNAGLSALVVGLVTSLACSSNDATSEHPAGGAAGKAGAAAGSPSETGGKGAAGSPAGGRGGTSTSGAGRGGSSSGKGGRGGGSGSSGRGGTSGTGEAGDGNSAGAAGDTGPAPASTWVNATGNLANMQSECGNLTLVSASPDTDAVIAGVAKGGLFASTDSGMHWSSLGTGAGSAVITNRPGSIVYDPKDSSIFWESGIYNGGGVYKTTDAGVTFEQLGDISHNDLVSVDFTDPDRKTLLVGGHEQKQTLYLSKDGGQSFDQIGANLPADSHFSVSPQVLDSKTFLLGACGYGDGVCGVYRSDDTGLTWTRVSDVSAAARPLWASDDSIYWPLIYNSGIARGTNVGMDWAKTADNKVSWLPVELPDGRILTLGGDHVVVSADHGSTWTPVGDTLPFSASGVTYSVRKKTLFVWHWDCGSVVLPDAIASAGFDYTKE